MKPSFRFLLTIFVITGFPQNAGAQQGSPSLFIGPEIGLEDQTLSTEFVVTIQDEDLNVIYSQDSTSPAYLCDESRWNFVWLANTLDDWGSCQSAIPPPAANPVLHDLDMLTVYNLTFDAGQPQALRIQFVECGQTPTVSFYCVPGTALPDLRIVFSPQEEFTVWNDQMSYPQLPWNIAFPAGDFIMPLHASAYCAKLSALPNQPVPYATCIATHRQIQQFVSNRHGKTFDLTSEDMLVETDWVWDEGAVVMNFASDTGIDIASGASLSVTNGTTLTFSEDLSETNDGFELLGSGARLTFAGATVTGGDLRLSDSTSVVFSGVSNDLNLDSFVIDQNVTIGDSLTTGSATISYNDFAMWGSTLTIKGGQTLVLEQDLTVPYGGTLVLEAGAALEFAPGTKLIVDGTLTADGATLTGSGSVWEGLELQSQATATFTGGSSISEVGSGMKVGVGATLTLDSSTLSFDTTGGVRDMDIAFAGSLILRGATVSDVHVTNLTQQATITVETGTTSSKT
jgi:hypothetical protein